MSGCQRPAPYHLLRLRYLPLELSERLHLVRRSEILHRLENRAFREYPRRFSTLLRLSGKLVLP